MIRPDLQIAELGRSISGGGEVFAVHYACESFYEPLDHPPMISAISISTVPPGDDRTFSLADTQEADPELLLLSRFYDWLRSKPDSHIVHWNMNRTEYGFGAIATRFGYLVGKEPDTSHAQDRLFDLSELISFRHGADYASHPRLGTLIAERYFFPLQP